MNTKKKGFDPDSDTRKKRKTKEKSLVSTSLDFEKTKKLYDSSARVTVEVLDDASPDNTPRLDDDNTRKLRQQSSIYNDLKTAALHDSESVYRTLKFATEKGRVEKNDDVFVPAPGVSLQDIESERTRLARIEDSARMKQRELDRDKRQRKAYLLEDKSAVKIQSAFRGHLGRTKFKLIRRIKDINNGALEEWIEVRDKESGDVWYYNTANGSDRKSVV